MTYLLIGLLLIAYYIFMAPKTIKSTMNTVLFVGVAALLLVLGVLGMIRLVQSPPEIFVGVAMTILGGFVLADVLKLEDKK